MALYKKLNIDADLAEEIKSNQSSLVAVKGDVNAHKIDITFLNSSAKEELDLTGWQLSVRYFGSNEFDIEDIFTMSEKNKIEIDVNLSIFDYADKYKVQLTLTNLVDRQVLTCPKLFGLTTKNKMGKDADLAGVGLLDTHVREINKPDLDNYTEIKKVELGDYTEVSKADVTYHTENKKVELDDYTSVKRIELEETISDADSKKVELGAVITLGEEKKVEVEETISDADSKKIEMQNKIDEGSSIITTIENQGSLEVSRVITQGELEINKVSATSALEIEAIIGEGTTQIARVILQGDTDILRVIGEGGTQIARVIDKNNEYVREVESDIASIETATIEMKSALGSDYTTDRTILQNATDRAIKLINDVKNESVEMLKKIK